MPYRSPALAATALLVATASPALAQDLTPFTFATNWYPQAEHGGYYQAVADGTYEACGLDVTIEPGGPQVNGRAQLIAGRIDAYMGGNLLQSFSAVREGIPSLVVAAHFQKEPQVVMSHPGEGLDTFEDLTEASTYIIGDNGFQSFFRWMASEYGFDTAKRQPYTFNPAAFIADPKSVQQGYLTSEPYAIASEGGFEPNVFLLADYGFDTYATTVEMMAPFVEENPEAVQCFVDGSAIGWTNYLYGDNAAANALIQEANPEMTDEQLAYSREKLIEYGIVDSGEATEDGIGAMTAERIEGFYRTMVEAGVIEDDIDVAEVYTLDFVNKGVGLEEKAALGAE